MATVDLSRKLRVKIAIAEHFFQNKFSFSSIFLSMIYILHVSFEIST